ncbi:hypothetical protein YC2023_093950 [Brassica napus]
MSRQSRLVSSSAPSTFSPVNYFHFSLLTASGNFDEVSIGSFMDEGPVSLVLTAISSFTSAIVVVISTD